MHRFGGILRFEARDILPRRRTSKSIELSRSSRTIFRKAKHEKPRQFYLRSYLLHLFPRSIPSLSLPFFSLALKHELLHLIHPVSQYVREFFRVARASISMRTRCRIRCRRGRGNLASRQSDTKVSLLRFSRACVSRQFFAPPRREHSIAWRGGIFEDYRARGVTRGGIVILLFGRKLNSDLVHRGCCCNCFNAN